MLFYLLLSSPYMLLCWFKLQILVLLSNTKKGEIERTFPRSRMFCVLVNNTRNLSNQVLRCAGIWIYYFMHLSPKRGCVDRHFYVQQVTGYFQPDISIQSDYPVYRVQLIFG